MNREKSKNHQNEFENHFVHTKLDGFNPKSSKAWLKLTERYGPKISHDEILSLALVISENMDIYLSREYKRRKNMLIKWFDENIEYIWPFIENCIIVRDTNDNIINFTK